MYVYIYIYTARKAKFILHMNIFIIFLPSNYYKYMPNFYILSQIHWTSVYIHNKADVR